MDWFLKSSEHLKRTGLQCLFSSCLPIISVTWPSLSLVFGLTQESNVEPLKASNTDSTHEAESYRMEHTHSRKCEFRCPFTVDYYLKYQLRTKGSKSFFEFDIEESVENTHLCLPYVRKYANMYLCLPYDFFTNLLTLSLNSWGSQGKFWNSLFSAEHSTKLPIRSLSPPSNMETVQNSVLSI